MSALSPFRAVRQAVGAAAALWSLCRRPVVRPELIRTPPHRHATVHLLPLPSSLPSFISFVSLLPSPVASFFDNLFFPFHIHLPSDFLSIRTSLSSCISRSARPCSSGPWASSLAPTWSCPPGSLWSSSSTSFCWLPSGSLYVDLFGFWISDRLLMYFSHVHRPLTLSGPCTRPLPSSRMRTLLPTSPSPRPETMRRASKAQALPR